MKRTLWMGVAAIALLAGINAAPAQMGGDQQQRMQNTPSGNRGEERIKPGIHEREPGATVQLEQKGKINAEPGGGNSGKMGRDQDRDRIGRDQDRDRMSRDRDHDRMGRDLDRGNQERMSRDQDRDKQVIRRSEDVGKSVRLSVEQRDRIHTRIIGERAEHRTDVNFQVSVGARVPRTVRIFPLPVEIVDIVPEYRGYDYVLVGDEILIIDPYTLEIVAILPA